MQRALDLAELGRGRVSPNPMVGCVIVHGETIVGEGWHQVFGGPHAEVNAIQSVVDPTILSECTLYVSLEPCAHFGKTPPCADLIVKHGLKRVVVALEDPNPTVKALGIKKLRDAGIEVTENVLVKEAASLNRRFLTALTKKRPYVILKWAQTADGFIARENFDSKWISNELSRKWVHRWRSEEDAILVGTNTVKYDNPQLNVRDWVGRDPVRLIIDRNLVLQGNGYNIFDGSQKTICYTLKHVDSTDACEFVRVDAEDFLGSLLSDAESRAIQSVMVEAGVTVLNAFMMQNLWDEARVFESTKTFERGIVAPRINAEVSETVNVIGDELKIYYHEQNQYR